MQYLDLPGLPGRYALFDGERVSQANIILAEDGCRIYHDDYEHRTWLGSHVRLYRVYLRPEAIIVPLGPDAPRTIEGPTCQTCGGPTWIMPDGQVKGCDTCGISEPIH